MNLPRINRLTGMAIHLPGDDIDTDRIIPARFMKCLTFEGLGQYAFYDERYDETNNPKHHPFNNQASIQNSILICGANFGCGSSREHAPQALFHFGVRAIVAESFAEIFAGNCTGLGIPCVTVSHNSLAEIIDILPSQLTICLETSTISADGLNVEFTMPSDARKSLLDGTWDPIAELLQGESKIAECMSRLPYVIANRTAT